MSSGLALGWKAFFFNINYQGRDNYFSIDETVGLLLFAALNFE